MGTNRELILIYRLTNLKNGKVYIGQTNDLNRRLDEHTRGKTYLSRALRKHGVRGFSSEVVDSTHSRDEAGTLEQAHIVINESLAPHGYNCNTGGKHYAMNKSIRRKISQSNTGKKFTEEHRANISRSMMGRTPFNKGKKMSTEEKAEYILGQVTRKRVRCIETSKEYESLRDASRQTSINREAIALVCSGNLDCEGYKRRTAGGKRWCFCD